MSIMRKYMKRYQMGGDVQSDLNPWDPGYYVPGERPAVIMPPTKDYEPVAKTDLWGQLGTKVNDVLPYATNVINQFKSLPSPKTPVLQDYVSPELVNFDADRADLDKQLRGMNAGISQASANPSITNAQRVSNLGKVLEARGRLSQSERTANAEIRNRVNMFNANIKGSNTDRLNSYNDSLVSKSVAEQRMRSENLADLSNKLQLDRRDKRMMELENKKLDIIPRVYKDTGVVDRNLSDLLMKEYYGKDGQYTSSKMGGKLRTMKNC